MKISVISSKEFLKELEFLFKNYSEELRATTQPYYLKKAQEQLKDYIYRPEDPLVRETLMEHIGSLPMVATAMFPYLNDPHVDLGKTLTMLAIHDIGELITGDEMTFTKQASAKDPERDAALSLLHESYHELYDQVENQTNKSAQFAKAVDKITPDIYDYLTPADITIWRYKHFVGIEPEEIIPLIEAKKRPYMTWNPFMAEFHVYLLERLGDKIASAMREKHEE